jgi:hypothetical protein
MEAADAYEVAISESSADLPTYLDLAVLYFECTDHGYRAHHHLPNDFVQRAAERMKEVLTAAALRFGRDGEIEFWGRYFDYVYLGEVFLPEEAAAMTNATASLVPYFFLFASADGDRYRRQAEELLEHVEGGRTARERWIRSVLAGEFRRRRT